MCTEDWSRILLLQEREELDQEFGSPLSAVVGSCSAFRAENKQLELLSKDSQKGRNVCSALVNCLYSPEASTHLNPSENCSSF